MAKAKRRQVMVFALARSQSGLTFSEIPQGPNCFRPLPRFCGSLEAPKPEPLIIGEHFYGLGRDLGNSSQCKMSHFVAIPPVTEHSPFL